MRDATRQALVSRLSDADRAVEIGIGTRPSVAAALAERGVVVTATDICDREVPAGVRFVRDDVTAPARPVYADADTLYALNLPPDLQVPVATLARSVGARCLFTTLGGDPAVVPTEPVTIPGETLYILPEGPAVET